MALVSRILGSRESRSSLSNPPQWLREWLGGGTETITGIRVDEKNALKFIAVLACIRILSETVASLPLPLYRRLEPRGKEKAYNHPLYPVLHDVANPEMTSFALRETLQAHAASWGNAYAEIEWSNGGWVKALWPLRPDRVEPRRINGELVYELTLPNGQPRPLAKERVLHIHWLGFDGLKGYSPIGLAKEAIGLGLATEQYGARFYKNNGRPGGYLETDQALSDTAYDRLKKWWGQRHEGLENAHRLAILEEGLKFHDVGFPPGEAQFLETRKFQVVEIARLYRVPPHMLADLDRATFANIEHQGLEFVQYSMHPWFARWEQTMNMRLLSEAERRRYFVEFLVDGLLRGDIKSRYEAYAVARQNGFMNGDEIRERENMNPMPDGQGEVYFAPLNMVPIDQLASGGMDDPEPSPTRSETRSYEQRAAQSATERRRIAKAYRTVIEDAARRIVKRERADIMREAERQLGRRSVADFQLWLDDFYHDHRSYVIRQMDPVVRGLNGLVQPVAANEIGSNGDDPQEITDFLETYVAFMADRHIGHSKGQLADIMRDSLSEEEALAALRERFDEWEENRPSKIARGESTRAVNAISKQVYRGGGRTSVRWMTFGDNCPYCNELSGKVVGIDEPFVRSGEEFQPEGAEEPLNPPGDVGHAPAHGGCDCMIAAA